MGEVISFEPSCNKIGLCGCENRYCKVRHHIGRCDNVGTIPCMFIGQICEPCSKYLPEKYLGERG